MNPTENKIVRETMGTMDQARQVFNNALRFGQKDRIIARARLEAERLTELADRLEKDEEV